MTTDSNVSLIEIAGEDDSLLNQIPTNLDSSAADNDCFSCSPLQIPVSNRSAELVGATQNCLTPTDGGNKENMDLNKLEVPSLCVEPKQMKRKKKNGGYNLRKSLAWDKAFFTEEGVLNSEELSMLSGTFSYSRVEALSVINEEEPTSHNGTKCHAYSSNSQVSGKAISPFRNKLGSKVGLRPRPLASSSSKIYEDKFSKVANKESKHHKVSGKPASSLSSTAKNPASTSIHLKHRQISEPVTDNQKNVGLKSSYKKAKCAIGKTKPGQEHWPVLADTSAENSRRTLGNSTLESQSLTNKRPMLAGQANSDLRMNLRPEVPPSRAHVSGAQDRRPMMVSSGQFDAPIAGKNTNIPHIQSSKPSGLRMPSPVMGFFSQPTALFTAPLSQRNIQPHSMFESSISTSRSCNKSKIPLLPDRLPKYYTPSAPTMAPHAKIKLHSCANDAKVEVDLSLGSKSCKSLDSKHAARINSHEGMVSCVRDNAIQENSCTKSLEHSKHMSSHNSPVPLRSVSGTKTASQSQREEEKPQGSSLENYISCSESHLEDTVRCKKIPIAGQDDSIRCMHGSNGSSVEQVSYINYDSAEASQEFNGEDCILQNGIAISRKSIEYEKSLSHCGIELNNSVVLSHLENEGAVQRDHLINNLVEDEKHQMLKKSLHNRNLSTVQANNTSPGDPFDLYVERLLLGGGRLSGPRSSQHNGVISMPERAASVIQYSDGVSASESNGSRIHIDRAADGLRPANLIISEMAKRHSEEPLSLSSTQSGHGLSLVSGVLQSDGVVINNMVEQHSEEPRSPQFSCVAENSNYEDEHCDQNTKLEFGVSSTGELVSSVKSIQTSNSCHVMDMQNVMRNDAPLDDAIETTVDNSNRLSPSIKLKGINLAAEFQNNSELSVDAVLVDRSEMINEISSIPECPLRTEQADDNLAGSDKSIIEATVNDELDKDLATSTLSEQCRNVPDPSKLFNELPALSNVCPVEKTAHDLENTMLQDGAHYMPQDCADYMPQDCADYMPQDCDVDGDKIDSQNHMQSSIQSISPGLEVLENKDQTVRPFSLQRDEDSIDQGKPSDDTMNLRNPVLKPPSNAIPFSDEWLAAIEAVGEEILTIKSGAVQNSPPDKSLPEPGPWSPVKRKNNQIGPFDCTKCTNIQHSNSN